MHVEPENEIYEKPCMRSLNCAKTKISLKFF